jgi:Cu/Ag efflux protein CusF
MAMPHRARIAGPRYKQAMLLRCLLVLALSAGCGGKELPASDPTAERFSTRGKVMKIEGHTVDIFHEHIPRILTVDGTFEPMAPMTMHFSATQQAPLGGIAVGDAVKIEFTTHYKTDAVLRLVSIEKLPPGTELALPR